MDVRIAMLLVAQSVAAVQLPLRSRARAVRMDSAFPEGFLESFSSSMKQMKDAQAAKAGARAVAHQRAIEKMKQTQTQTQAQTQAADLRVAQVSHVMMRTDEAACAIRTKGECYELLCEWKKVIEAAADPAERLERFEICARERSECSTKDVAGALGTVNRGSLYPEFDDLAFAEDAEPGAVYGPVETRQGLHLMYLHSCRVPEGKGAVLAESPASNRE